jgi:sensor histidine kinase YesM
MIQKILILKKKFNLQLNKGIDKTNWKFAILFSATLTLFNMTFQDQNLKNRSLESIVLTCFLIFSFLLLVWFVNSYLQINSGIYNEKKAPVTNIIVLIICNLILLVLLLLALIPLMDGVTFGGVKPNYVFMIILFRGSVGICLVYIIQTAIYSNAKAQEILLQNQMLKTENIRSQLEILKQQISPHFLFNSLATLRSMIRLNNPNSEQFVLKLSEVYRQLLINRQLDAVTIKEELIFVNDYIYMLKARFDEMLCITIDIPENLLSLKLPTFSLQLLIENCMKHNIVSVQKPLKIKIFCPSADTITVENNLQSKVSQFEKSGYGLENLDQRYNLLGWSDSVTVLMDEEMFRVDLKLLTI